MGISVSPSSTPLVELPPEYADFADVFINPTRENLPEHSKFDLKIKLQDSFGMPTDLTCMTYLRSHMTPMFVDLPFWDFTITLLLPSPTHETNTTFICASHENCINKFKGPELEILRYLPQVVFSSFLAFTSSILSGLYTRYYPGGY
jgi:hypothetical protein